ncbi:hypothetical protein I4U23_031412 [Adineta vaga]|nr:hypothetical protein I4U23_031412 [Adineta vaga]
MQQSTVVDKSPLSISINEFSPIEHLIINNKLEISELNALLSYLPQLRRLSIDSLYQSNDPIIPFSIQTNYLTHVSLYLTDISFDQFEIFIKNISHQLQVLYITIDNDTTYLDADRWEKLIVSSMPYLRIFNIHCEYFSKEELVIESLFLLNSGLIDNGSLHLLLNHQQIMIVIENKIYTLYGSPHINMLSNRQKMNMNSVQHLDIREEQKIDDDDDGRNYFPNVTELTLAYDDINVDGNHLSIILSHIIPLVQLTKLNIDADSFPFETMLQLLYSTLNIHTLTLNRINFDSINFISIKQTEFFQLISNKNQIKNLDIDALYACEQIKLLIHLCPQLECLRMQSAIDDFDEILRYLLLKDNSNIRCLFFISIVNLSSEDIANIETMMKSKETVDDYIVRSITQDFDHEIYLLR